MSADAKDYFAGLTVCTRCGGSTEEPTPVCCGAVNATVNCGGKGCTGPVVPPCKECGGTGALGPLGEPAVAL